MDARRRHPLVPYVILPLLLSAYVLSYAPMFRLACGRESGLYPMGGPIGVYQPVDWLIDNTPFDQPLLQWAEICAVGPNFRTASAMRCAPITLDPDIPYRQGSFLGW